MERKKARTFVQAFFTLLVQDSLRINFSPYSGRRKKKNPNHKYDWDYILLAY